MAPAAAVQALQSTPAAYRPAQTAAGAGPGLADFLSSPSPISGGTSATRGPAPDPAFPAARAQDPALFLCAIAAHAVHARVAILPHSPAPLLPAAPFLCKNEAIADS